jgi:hypothetical protein
MYQDGDSVPFFLIPLMRAPNESTNCEQCPASVACRAFLTSPLGVLWARVVRKCGQSCHCTFSPYDSMAVTSPPARLLSHSICFPSSLLKFQGYGKPINEAKTYLVIATFLEMVVRTNHT